MTTRSALLLFAYVFVFLSCNEPSKVTEVSGQENEIEYPCLSSSSDCLNKIDILDGTFQVFSSFHIDSSSDVRGAVISIHGDTRNADDYFDKMVSIISSQISTDEIMIIAPKFITTYEKTLDTDWYWNTTSWKWGMQSYNSPFGQNISSFQAIDSLLSKLSNKQFFPQLSDVIITGHSSGAAFVHMLSYSKSNNNFKGINIHFAVVNNQYFTHPESRRMYSSGTLSTLDNCDGYNDWPYGLSNLSPYMELIGEINSKNNFFSNKVDYFISENDTESDNITPGCQLEILGNNRFEKTINYMTYLNMIYPENKHEHTIIPNLNHSTNSLSSDVFRTYIDSIF